MKVSFSIFIASLLLLTLNNCKQKHAEETKPNVILIMTDDQGYGDLACHGNPYVKTPTLDKLYEESVRFTDFHVDPCCAPTRSALMTGCYSSRAGVWHTIGGRSLLKEGMTTIADVFKENGYETAVFGKWHLGENYPFRPMDRGFKESIVHGGGGVGQSPDYWGNDYFDDSYKHNGKFEKYEGYCNTVWFSEALKYIQKNKEKPFFCYVATNLPHAPLRVGEKYIEPYKNDLSDRLASYYGMITKLDEDIATLLQGVQELGLEENTILIFMTDNGPCPWFGGIDMDFETGYPKEGYAAGMRGGKIWGYENAHRVPFFIRWPKGNIGGGKDIDALSAHIDVMPTLIDLCQLNKPEKLDYDGQSLAPLLNEDLQNWDERTLFVHNQRVQFPVKDKEYQVLTDKWRLVKREKDELYNIKKDPGQHNDIAAKHPDVVKKLYKKYEKWWDDTSVGFDKYSQIYIGSEHENPTCLYSHDSFSRQGKRVWVLHVDRDGEYEFKVNKWRQESGKRMVENKTGDKDLPLKTAWLKVGNIEREMEITPDMQSATFTVNLKAGTSCIQACLKYREKGKRTSANCVYVNYLGESDGEISENYIPANPDDVLRKNYEQKVIAFD
ncbi:arylsulfatase [Saccharicrinis sp. GN24d3]|uniref:arylsulfatase n=1 Tax=Saccharicrinis sp. GN24d3 TaxID=3458416 RepID=UPI0040354BAC